jgi:hypothetical protein
MGYKALVDSNITLAFNLLKDMAKDVILNKSSANSYDFGTATVSDKKTELPIKAVVLEDDKKSKMHNSIKRQLLFKTRGLGDLNAYDTVLIEDDNDSSQTLTWRFGPMINNDGYTILAEIYREA